ncbi:thiamine phosphate synthase [Shimia sagamensis]|uniref:Thiamine-phosphate pyrophosphorylase n=1 Tax=Shimia sagamensis TaxID=1566352 RepID=A0ABY1PCZ7_9RHOB|nr:thiamine phosphate synthase [Shimia sagamensis]SMP31750.1 thiamine-phosphate pyrophosphorylase [Shimia sagamensis]
MSDTELPQIYLITPPEIELSRFPDQLAAVLDAADIACVRLALATKDEDRLSRAADALREVAHARDVAIVINEHVQLSERLGLDGVHLTDAARSVAKTRKELGQDAIVGTFCSASSHEGMSAGESGADYVAFGPVGSTNLGDGTLAEKDLFEWWSTMIEVPVVAEGALDTSIIAKLSPFTDFFGIGEEIWRSDDPVAKLKELHSAFTA